MRLILHFFRCSLLIHKFVKNGSLLIRSWHTYDIILDKPGSLSNEEYALVKMHPVKGEEILRPVRQLQNVLPVIRHHHERIDGNGYPDRLRGEEIPFFARIVHVADSFDSMTADRPYRPAPGKEYAVSELKKYSGLQFDPKVVEAFLKILEDPEKFSKIPIEQIMQSRERITHNEVCKS